MFDEITNTQVLGDVELSNRAGKRISQRFKLDSGACANLLPLGIYSKLFAKGDRDLKASIDPRVLSEYNDGWLYVWRVPFIGVLSETVQVVW